jgi:hypothetical protein
LSLAPVLAQALALSPLSSLLSLQTTLVPSPVLFVLILLSLSLAL